MTKAVDRQRRIHATEKAAHQLCEECGKPIENCRINQKYHAGECKRLGRLRKQYKERKAKLLEKSPIRTEICPYCKTKYETRRDTHTCRDVKCKNRYQREKRKRIDANLTVEEKRARNKKHYERYAQQYIAKAKRQYLDDKGHEESQTLLCKCPGCEETFMHTFYPAWAGNPKVMPRIGCDRYPHCVNGPARKPEVGKPALRYESEFSVEWEMGNGAML